MKTAVFHAGFKDRYELSTSRRLTPVTTLQGKKDGSLITGLYKAAITIRSVFNTLIRSAITFKPVDNRHRSGQYGRRQYRY